MSGNYDYDPRPVPVETSTQLRSFLDDELAAIADRLNGKNAQWDDLRFPACAITPSGLTSDPVFDTVNGGWLFDANTNETIYLTAQMPHGWKEGSEIRPHVHWQKTTAASGAVLWRLDYKKAPINAVMDAAFTTLNRAYTITGTPDTDTADKHLISAFDPIDMTGSTLSDMLVMKLTRRGGNTSDTYGADARLLEFDIHYQLNGLGSGREFIK